MCVSPPSLQLAVHAERTLLALHAAGEELASA